MGWSRHRRLCTWALVVYILMTIWIFMAILLCGTVVMLTVMKRNMTFMVDLATTLSFIMAPILAIINYRVVTDPRMPPRTVPRLWLKTLSWIGMVLLTLMSVMFLVWKFLL